MGVSLLTMFLSSSLSDLPALRLEVLEGADVLEVVVVMEGLDTGLKVALRSSSQGGMRSLDWAPACLTHL